MEQWGTIYPTVGGVNTVFNLPTQFTASHYFGANEVSVSFGVVPNQGVPDLVTVWYENHQGAYYCDKANAYIYWRIIGKWNLDRRVVPSGTLVGANKVFAVAQINGAKSVAQNSPIPFDAIGEDAYSTITLATGRFTAPKSDVYIISGVIQRTTAIGNSVVLFVNGVSTRALVSFNNWGYSHPITAILRLNQGDYIDVRPDGAIGVNVYRLEVLGSE